MEEETIDLREYLDVALRRWWLLVLVPVLAGVVAFGLSLRQSPPSPEPEVEVYEASAILLMEGAGALGRSPELVTAKPVLNDTINDLGLSVSVEELRPKVSADRIDGAPLLQINVMDADPARAEIIANGVAQSFIDYVVEFQEPQVAATQEELTRQLSRLATGISDQAVEELVRKLDTLVKRPAIIASAEVIEDAIANEPVAAAKTHTTRNVALGVALGGMLAVALVIALEYLQSPVRSPNQLERRFPLTRLGVLPRWPKRDRQPFRIAEIDSPCPVFEEATNRLAANIAMSSKTHGMRSIIVASPASGDGRSTVVANVGVALAGMWRDVVLVDADLRNPTLHRYFDLDNSVGLSSFLTTPNLDIADIVQETQHARLKVVTSGPQHPNPMELLTCPRMMLLLDQFKHANHFVLLDSPPVLATTDAIILASQTQGVILLVNGERNNADLLGDTVASLWKTNVPFLGYIWNRAGRRTSGVNSDGYRARRPTKSGLDLGGPHFPDPFTDAPDSAASGTPDQKQMVGLDVRS